MKKLLRLDQSDCNSLEVVKIAMPLFSKLIFSVADLQKSVPDPLRSVYCLVPKIQIRILLFSTKLCAVNLFTIYGKGKTS